MSRLRTRSDHRSTWALISGFGFVGLLATSGTLSLLDDICKRDGNKFAVGRQSPYSDVITIKRGRNDRRGCGLARFGRSGCKI